MRSGMPPRGCRYDRARHLRVFGAAAVAALFGGLALAPNGTAAAELLSNGSFEGSLSGWRGHYATLSLTSGGAVGSSAARISFSGSSKTFAIYPSPRPVSATQAGAVYNAAAWQRTPVSGRQICLRIREWSLSGSVVGAARTCRKSTTNWAAFNALSYSARSTGNQLDVYVHVTNASAGDRFDVDGISLTTDAISHTPDPPPSPPATEPTPLPAPSTGAHWSNGFDLWGGAAIPDASWRPFADTSPFNRPVPANPRVMPNSAEIMSRIWAMDGDSDRAPQNLDFDPSMTRNEPNGTDWAHPIFWSRPSDPKLKINCVKYGCPDLQGKVLPVPAEARSADGGDGHFGLILRDPTQPFHLFVVDLYEAYSKPTIDGATWNVGSGGVSRVDGSGTNVDIDGNWNVASTTGQSEATAARFSVAAGVIRAPHIQAGRIPHAIFFTTNCDSGTHVYPAQRSGRPCSAIGQANTNAPPMGARLWLDMSAAEIDALSVKPTLKTILKALNEYGAYMGDTGGGGYGFGFESPETYHSVGLQSPFLEVARQEGWIAYNGTYVLKPVEVPDSVWSRVKVLDPCVSSGSC